MLSSAGAKAARTLKVEPGERVEEVALFRVRRHGKLCGAQALFQSFGFRWKRDSGQHDPQDQTGYQGDNGLSAIP